jgi:hypothetical protein
MSVASADPATERQDQQPQSAERYRELLKAGRWFRGLSAEVLMPGESITTTCTFSEPKCSGQATTQEMCFMFTYAYPPYALVDNGQEGAFLHGKGACVGQ